MVDKEELTHAIFIGIRFGQQSPEESITETKATARRIVSMIFDDVTFPSLKEEPKDIE